MQSRDERGKRKVLIQKQFIPPSLAVDDVYFNFRIASSDGLGSFRVVSGGTDCKDYTTDLSGLVEVPSTGGNTRYEDLPV